MELNPGILPCNGLTITEHCGNSRHFDKSAVAGSPLHQSFAFRFSCSVNLPFKNSVSGRKCHRSNV
jgi:hypothetical protein